MRAFAADDELVSSQQSLIGRGSPAFCRLRERERARDGGAKRRRRLLAAHVEELAAAAAPPGAVAHRDRRPGRLRHPVGGDSQPGRPGALQQTLRLRAVQPDQDPLRPLERLQRLWQVRKTPRGCVPTTAAHMRLRFGVGVFGFGARTPLHLLI